MRIFFIGSLSNNSLSRHYVTAFENLGHTVHAFDPQYFSSNHIIQKTFQRIFKRPSPQWIERRSNALIQEYNTQNFDLAFVLAENFIPTDILDYLSQKSTLFYHSHDNNFSKGILKPTDFFSRLKKYHKLFTTKSQNVAHYHSLGLPPTEFLPSAYERSIHYPPKRKIPILFPISFIGTYDRSRDRYLESLDWTHLRVWGNRWRQYPHYFAHRNQIYPHAIYNESFRETLWQSQMSLGLLREEAQDLHTTRTFEIPACGTLQISPRNSEILSFFEENKEIICFDSPEELKDKVTYCLRNPNYTEKISEAGLKRCLQGSHSYQDRAQSILRDT